MVASVTRSDHVAGDTIWASMAAPIRGYFTTKSLHPRAIRMVDADAPPGAMVRTGQAGDQSRGQSTITASFDTNDVMPATFSQNVINGANWRNDERGCQTACVR